VIMTEDDWKHFAKTNQMNPEEFTSEILCTAINVCGVLMDKDDADMISCQVGDYELTVRKRDVRKREL
jgi:hypothetical protein